jgi:hypothetical protein
MDHDPWRAVLIIERKDARHMDTGIQRLRRAGFEHIHVMAAAGVTVSKHYQPMSHQSKDWVDGYTLWRGALELMGEVYGPRSELFLVMRPNFHLWGALMQYCELTIDRGLLAIWSPFTPDRLFPSSDQLRPLCKGTFGWCPTQVDADASVAECLVMTGHMLTLAKEYMPITSEGGSPGNAMSMSLGRRKVPFYYHMPSLVTTEEHMLEASDFVGVTKQMSRKEMLSDKRILEPKAAGRYACRR